MKRLFCLWLPNWPIQRVHAQRVREQRAGIEPETGSDTEPESTVRPIVLWREDPRRGRVVAACCRHARAAGVQVLLPVAQATEMVQRTSVQPQLHQHDLDADEQALRQLAWEVQQHITPIVETETLDEKPWAGFPRHQRESLIGEISGVTHLFDDEQGLLNSTHQLLQRLNLFGRVAIADSLGAAWAVAHFGAADDSVGPGQWLVPSHATRLALKALPIESLRIDLPTAETLVRLGIESVDELLQLPKDGLAARLGRRLVQRIEQALENREEPLSVEAAPAEDQATLELEYPTSDQKILADRVSRLMREIRTGLAARQRGAIRVTCRLDLVIPPPLFLEIGLFAPSVDDEHVSSLIVHRLENIRLASDVKRITMAVPLSGPLRTAQQALFETDHSTNQLSGSALSRLIDSLSGRLGRESVVSVQLRNDPLPENAYRVTPMAGNQTSVTRKATNRHRKRSIQYRSLSQYRSMSGEISSDRTSASDRNDQTTADQMTADRYVSLPSVDDALRRPLFLFPDPIPLSVAFSGEHPFYQTVSTRQLPDRIRFAGVIHTVLRHWGPERIETGWWKGPTVRRDYYRIETDRGCWWWIFRNLASGKSRKAYRWMLHGKFD